VVGGRRFEVKMKKETPGVVVLGVNEKARNADGPSSSQGRFDGGLKEGCSKPSASVLFVHSHSGQDDCWNGIGHSSAVWDSESALHSGMLFVLLNL